MARGGSKPGERRGGRKAGTPNKATADIKALAKEYAPAAIRELARLMEHAESEAARVAAIKELFDRAYGKATTVIGGDADNPLRTIIRVELVAGEGAGE